MLVLSVHYQESSQKLVHYIKHIERKVSRSSDAIPECIVEKIRAQSAIAKVCCCCCCIVVVVWVTSPGSSAGCHLHKPSPSAPRRKSVTSLHPVSNAMSSNSSSRCQPLFRLAPPFLLSDASLDLLLHEMIKDAEKPLHNYWSKGLFRK